MFSTYTYDTVAEVCKFVQITDPHLFKDEKGELLGINTFQSFVQVVKEIKESGFDYDFVLATGDLVQDSSDEGYLHFCDQIKHLEKMVFWIPGNHDFQPKMFDILNQDQDQVHLNAKKHLLLGKYWQILMLDSQVFGVPHGKLSQYQIDWLVSKLKDYPERHALIVLHHHILPTNSAWLDQHNLRNAYELAEALSSFNNVKGVMYGHIHQAVDSEWQGYKVMATPSTCIQFKPDNHSFTLDTLQPGWREVTLYPEGKIDTCVKRIQHAQFFPNMHEEGY